VDDFRTSINSGSIDPYEKIKVEEIEEKADETETEQKIEFRKKAKIASVIIFFSQKFLRLLPQKTSAQALLILEKDLDKLKLSLKHLAENDLSQDPEFLKELSNHWELFLDNFYPLSISKNKLISRIQHLIDEIHEYPLNQPYTLGYYLSEFAGLKWIPFPYIEILKSLHFEYQKNHSRSILYKWIDEIEEIIKPQ
jgi:hypothetical protein